MNTDGKFCYRYPHPAVTVDCVVFGFDGNALKVLLIERGIEPYKGMWALPGGFMKIDETVEQAAARELREETNLDNVFLQQFKVFSAVNRDPRERVVTVAFIALLRPDDCQLAAGDDASNALWFDERYLPPIAFDHVEIISQARRFLSDKLKLEPVAFQLLNKSFSLSDLQRVYEVITRKTYDRRNFQRKALQSGVIEEAGPDVYSGAMARPTVNMMSTSCQDELCEPEQEMSKRSSRRQAGRPAGRLFRFKDLFKPRQSDSSNEEGSTKDLFDF